VDHAAVSGASQGPAGAYRTDRLGFTERYPATDTWDTAPITNPQTARQVWMAQSWAVLLVCGRGVDVLELPWTVAQLLPVLAGRGLRVPVATVGPRRSVARAGVRG
jgi:hypothetical protein